MQPTPNGLWRIFFRLRFHRKRVQFGDWRIGNRTAVALRSRKDFRDAGEQMAFVGKGAWGQAVIAKKDFERFRNFGLRFNCSGKHVAL